MRLRLALIASVAAACGAPAPQPVDPASASVQSDLADQLGAAGGGPASTQERRGIELGPPSMSSRRLEPGPVEPYDPPADGAVELPIRVGQLRLNPGVTFTPPTSACQDVIVFVREGALEATGAGIAPPEAPATLYPGDAVRFGAEGEAHIVNRTDAPARTVIAFARADGMGPPQMATNLSDACPLPAAPPDPRVRPLRVASVATTDPLPFAGGTMRVRILLDAEGQGARFGGLSYLEADASARVPEHTHPDSAEVLVIEEGDGLMKIGDRQVRVQPGMTIYVPKGTLHDFRGAGTRPLRAIQIYAPSGPEQRFRGQ